MKISIIGQDEGTRTKVIQMKKRFHFIPIISIFLYFGSNIHSALKKTNRILDIIKYNDSLKYKDEYELLNNIIDEINEIEYDEINNQKNIFKNYLKYYFK